LPQTKGDLSIKEKFKNQYPLQNSSRFSATIHAANRCQQALKGYKMKEMFKFEKKRR
jgi:hypothetical protein